MSVEYGFFNSLNGDRKYNAEKLSAFFEGLISNGVFETVGNKLLVTAGEGMSINIDTGRAFINSHYIKNTAVLNLKLPAADVQFDKIVRIVIRCDTSTAVRAVFFEIKEGAPAISPVAPGLTRNETVFEMALADVLIPANSESVNQGNISDLRMNTSLCGFVTGLVQQVDTTKLFLQWQDAYERYYNEATAEFNAYMASKKKAFDEWLSALTESLNVDVTVHSYTSTFTTTEETTLSVPVNIAQYETGDIIQVNINGLLLNERTEYNISGTGEGATVEFVNAIEPDNEIGIVCIKSVIGSNEVIS